MSGILYVEEAEAEATTGHMLVTFKSGGDVFRFHLPAHVALKFRHRVTRDTWELLCAPKADVVQFKPKRKKDKPQC